MLSYRYSVLHWEEMKKMSDNAWIYLHCVASFKQRYIAVSQHSHCRQKGPKYSLLIGTSLCYSLAILLLFAGSGWNTRMWMAELSLVDVSGSWSSLSGSTSSTSSSVEVYGVTCTVPRPSDLRRMARLTALSTATPRPWIHTSLPHSNNFWHRFIWAGKFVFLVTYTSFFRCDSFCGWRFLTPACIVPVKIDASKRWSPNLSVNNGHFTTQAESSCELLPFLQTNDNDRCR